MFINDICRLRPTALASPRPLPPSVQRDDDIHLRPIAPAASSASIKTFSRIVALHHRIVFRRLMLRHYQFPLHLLFDNL